MQKRTTALIRQQSNSVEQNDVPDEGVCHLLAGFVLLMFLAVIPSTVVCAKPTADQATEIFNATGVKGGLIVHLGCSDGELTAALRVGDGYLVHGLDTDAKSVDDARRYIDSLGDYGPVSVNRFDGIRLPYVDNLVNLLVTEDLGKVPMAEVMRVLIPRGIAYVKHGDHWTKSVKPWPKEMDEWTHWLHGPDGNAVGHDWIVGPPRGLQWMAGPSWMRHHDATPSTSAMVSSHGRLFAICDEGPCGVDGRIPDQWFLIARNAFNGVLLWKRPMSDWGWNQWTVNWHSRNNLPFQLPKRLVAIDETVYTTLAFNAPLTALDAATGEIIRTYEGTEYTDEILVHDGLLVLSLNNAAHHPSENNHVPLKKSIAVIKADTGEILWKRGSFLGLHAKSDSIEPLGRLELAVGDGQIFLTDQDAIVALDLNTGRKVWQIPRPQVVEYSANFHTRMNELCVLVYKNGVVLFAQPEGGISFHSVPGTLYALNAVDGKLLWEHRYGGWVHNTQPNVFVIDDLVWIHEHEESQWQGKAPPAEVQARLPYALLGLDLHNGEEKRRISTRDTFDVGHHHRCYRNKATERFLLTSRRGVEFLDLNSGENSLHHWTRGGCQLGIMPCNGLLYSTPHPCECYIAAKLNGFYALAPERTSNRPNISLSTKELSRRLERGPAYVPTGQRELPVAGSADWPTFRGNAQRSGSTTSRVSATLTRCWSTDMRSRIGPMTVSDGKVFVPVTDKHCVVALDAATGRKVWTFIADGRLDTPPTIDRGLVLFGSANGSVYCLRSTDGQLAWRRRVAPQDRLIGVRSQLESAWPVPGSILVKDDVAYLAAGRSSYLDGGIHLYALKPATGDIVEHRVVYSPEPQTGKMPPGDAHVIPGMLADILVSDGVAVWMRQNRVFGSEASARPHVFATGGFRDDSWFNRTTWAVGGVKGSQLLVFDGRFAYGIDAYGSVGRNKVFKAGEKGYEVFAKPLNAGRTEKRRGGERHTSPGTWSQKVPIRATAVVLTGDALFLAGAPDVVDPNDPGGAFVGRKGGLLWAISRTDGKKLAEYKLDSPPVFDGMSAARGRLLLCGTDGRILCMGPNEL